MIKNQSVLAIIPARKGSKRLPGKNMISICGKPLISYTINSAIKSKYIDKIIVNTDSEQIINFCKKKDTVSFIKRPKNLANDNSKTIGVILHTLKKERLLNNKYDLIILLQPTSPFRNQFHIDKSIELMVNKKANSIISVCKNSHPIEWSGHLKKNLSLQSFFKSKKFEKPSQKLPESYRLNGAIYLYKVSRIEITKSIFDKKKSYAFIMKRSESIDIDTKEDLEFVKYIFKKKKK